jgi:hypothetical protein
MNDKGPRTTPERHEPAPGNCLVVRVGHGANCSSIGSVIDTLFVSATVGGALLAAVCAAMKSERVVVVGRGAARSASDPSRAPSAGPAGGSKHGGDAS